MKLITHILFSMALLLVLESLFHVHYLLQVLVLSFVNVMIDFFGHSSYRGVRRTPFTHSLLSASLVGGAFGLAFYFVLPYFGVPTSLIFMVVGGVVAGLSHLLLDSLTYSGIFILRKRFAIAHFKNGPVDVPFAIVSFVVILYMLGLFTGV